MGKPLALFSVVVMLAACACAQVAGRVQGRAGGNPVVTVRPVASERAVKPARPVAPVQPAAGGLRDRGRGRGGRGYDRVYRNVQEGPDSLHRPWVGSDTYEKNLAARNGGRDGGRADFQRDRDATLDVYHREEDRARRIQHEESVRREQQLVVEANKAVIEANARAAEAERRAREAERLAEIRQRAVEQEREILRRRAEQEKVHDAILSSLPTCMGRNADGTPCTRKANPGHHYCHLHLDNEK